MWKRIIASLLIVFSIISLSTFSYATNTVDISKTVNNVDISKYEILKPEKLTYSTEDKVILIIGKAPSGSEVLINHYGTRTTDLTKNRFNLDKLPTEKDYVLILEDKVVSGNMGFFQKETELVKGINKINVDFGVEGLEPVEIIVYVYERVRPTRQARVSDILPLLR